MCHTRITRSPRGRAAGGRRPWPPARGRRPRETRVTYYVSNDIFIITLTPCRLAFSIHFVVKFYTFSSEDLEEVKTEERKFRNNLNNHIKKENLPLQVYTKVKGNKVIGYIQYTPNADRLKHSLQSVDTEDYKSIFDKRFIVRSKDDK